MTKDFVEMYIPTQKARNAICRNDSFFYAKELTKYKLWAAESKYILFILFTMFFTFWQKTNVLFYNECFIAVKPLLLYLYANIDKTS